MKISVIIPTLNEAAYIARAIESVRAQGPHEVLVVDGGSMDGTRGLAAGADRVLIAEAGRARQMNHGVRQATGEAFLFMHADCELEEGGLAEAARYLAQPGIAAGCFRLSIADRGLLYRSIDASATARVRLTGLAYGDQGLFVTRSVFDRAGGFPEVRFLEDLLLSRTLRQLGRIVVAGRRIFASSRRWRRAGLLRQTCRNWWLTALATAGVHPDRLARHYPVLR